MTPELRHFSTLPPVQQQVAAALAAGQTTTEAARDAGVHRSSIHNWRNEPGFKAAFDEIRQDLAESLKDQLHELEAKALDTIRQLMVDPKTPASVRLKAALSILNRPKYPAQGWNLPALEYPPRKEAIANQYAAVDEYHKRFRQENVARNAPCPCGSNSKYKRCCGKNAPPILGAVA